MELLYKLEWVLIRSTTLRRRRKKMVLAAVAGRRLTQIQDSAAELARRQQPQTARIRRIPDARHLAPRLQHLQALLRTLLSRTAVVVAAKEIPHSAAVKILAMAAVTEAR